MSKPTPSWFLVSRSEDEDGNVSYEQLPIDHSTGLPTSSYSPQLVTEQSVIRAVAGGLVYFTAAKSSGRWTIGAEVRASLTTAGDKTTKNNLLSLPPVGSIRTGNDSSGWPLK